MLFRDPDWPDVPLSGLSGLVDLARSDDDVLAQWWW
jgi:hypothetical protein